MTLDTNMLHNIPDEVLNAAELVSKYFESNNINNWKLGGIQQRDGIRSGGNMVNDWELAVKQYGRILDIDFVSLDPYVTVQAVLTKYYREGEKNERERWNNSLKNLRGDSL